MPASVIFGKRFEPEYIDGRIRDITPIDGEYEFVGRHSLLDVVNRLASCGIDPSLWPIFDVGVAALVPIERAISTCQQLVPKLLEIRKSEFVKDNEFLQLVISHIEQGRLFFILM